MHQNIFSNEGELELRKNIHYLRGFPSSALVSKCEPNFLVGQSVIYEQACELFEELVGVEISAPQIQQVCTHYGDTIDP